MTKIKSKLLSLLLVVCLIIPCILMLTGCGHTHNFVITYEIESDKVYEVETCNCKETNRTEIEGAIIATPETIQGLVDNASDNAIILLSDGDYDRIYLRKTANSTPVDNNWAGGNHTFARTINGLTILATENTTIKQIIAETATYTPSGNQHSNSANEPYLQLQLTINNLTIKNLNFELEGNDVAVHVLDHASVVDGLHIANCSFVDTDASSNASNGNRVLHSSSQTDWVKNVVVENCYFKDLHQAIKINCVKNLKVTNNTFDGLKFHGILLSGGSVTNQNKDGVIEISGNTIKTSIAERFVRISNVAETAEITMKNNKVDAGATLGADPDIVKIDKINANATVDVDKSNKFGNKTVTIEFLEA